VELTRRLAEMGYREISIADSVGLANPAQVRRLMRRLVREFPDIHFSMHIHNTRGLGLANVVAGLEEGIDAFDSSLGGLGGCPVVPGATGNIPTEDLVNMLEEMGVETGVDVEGVMVASRMAQEVLERTLPSYVMAAGTRQQLYRHIEKRERKKSVTR
jgi:hydroxymethylglutaryl-CoA lyase